METGADLCPPAVLQIIEQADIQTADGDALFGAVQEGTSLGCQLYALTTIAERLNSTASLTLVDAFAETTAMYARVLQPEHLDPIKNAYLRMPYDGSIAPSYFAGLRANRIDIREHLAERMTEDWSFVHPRDENAATWHYYLYLATLGTEGAMERLSEKMDAAETPNDLANLLRSFADVPGREATRVIRGYAKDDRRADGVDGPGTGIAIADAVEQILAYRK